MVAVELAFEKQPSLVEKEPNPVLLASELERDVFTRARCANFIGSISAGQEVELEATAELGEFDNLLEAVKAAAAGNPEAMKVVSANALSATIEALYKAGHVMRVKAKITQEDNILQHGQTMDSVSANSLRRFSKNPKMKPRTEAEALNIHRIKDAIASGDLNNYWLLMPSLYADDMTDEEAEAAGFFSDTKTGVLQLVTAEDDEIIIESVFVAGIKEKGEPRHDIEAVNAMYAKWGYDVSGLNTTELLASPVWVPKAQLPNGGADVAQMFDEPYGTFFGQNKLRQDYKEYLKVCREREAALEETTRAVVKDLITSYESLAEPQDAVAALYKSVKKRVLEYAVDDEDLDISIFGDKAEGYIIQARQHIASGNIVGATIALNNAEVVAKVTMCGTGNSKENDNKKDGENAGDDLESTESNTGLIKCFKCRRIVNKEKVVKDKTWCCPKCQYEVDICSGEVKNDGEEDKRPEPKIGKTIFERLAA